jgi:hypothetical protein
MTLFSPKPIPKLTLVEQNRFWQRVDASAGLD